MSSAVKPGHHETSVEQARQLARVDDEGHVFALAAGRPERRSDEAAGPAAAGDGDGDGAADAATTSSTASPESSADASASSSTESPASSPDYVGQYPEATADEALLYFARKFDDLYDRALLLKARVESAADGAKPLRESMQALRRELESGPWVGDVAALGGVLDEIAVGVDGLAAQETAEAEAAVEAHLAVREEIVAEAERLAAADPDQQHWKTAQQRMQELFDAWKAEQKKPPRITKAQEDPYWKRFRAARSTFDKNRRAFFSRRDQHHAEVKQTKEELIARAEELQHSTDFGPTTKAFHRLMDDWKAVGRGARKTDDAQWARFRAAQDVFFAARERANAETDAQYAQNLAAKEAILAELEELMPFTKPDQVREQYHALLERWDEAGRVPRGDVKRMEGALKRIQDAFREAEDAQWQQSDPETRARQDSMLAQLDETIAELEESLAAAREHGEERRIKEAEEALEARRSWRRMLAGE